MSDASLIRNIQKLMSERDKLRNALVKITGLNSVNKADLPLVVAAMRKIARDAVPDYLDRREKIFE